MRIDIWRRQRRRELPERLLAEGERLGRRRGRRGQHFRWMHRRRVLLPLAQLAVDDANRHHSTVTSDHGSQTVFPRNTRHRQDVPVGQSQHNTSHGFNSQPYRGFTYARN